MNFYLGVIDYVELCGSRIKTTKALQSEKNQQTQQNEKN